MRELLKPRSHPWAICVNPRDGRHKAGPRRRWVFQPRLRSRVSCSTRVPGGLPSLPPVLAAGDTQTSRRLSETMYGSPSPTPADRRRLLPTLSLSR